MTYHAKVIAGGKIVIPAELRRELGIKDGDRLVIERNETGAITVKTYSQVVREVQALFRPLVEAGESVDKFLVERRANWGEE